MNALLEITGLQKFYGDVEAIRDVSISLAIGEFVCLVGPSGCGKTTLLKCAAGLLRPTDGTITLAGQPVTEPPADLAVVFQEYGRSLFPWLTVRRNVELPLKAKRLDPAKRRQIVNASLAAVGLADRGEAYPWQLSGGMQQRVAIARAVACEPQVLLMDEPFAAVDAQTRADLEDLIQLIWARLGMTILFVTHDIDEAVYLGQRVVVLSSSPTVVRETFAVDLPLDRDQLTTRADPRFTELRANVYAEIQAAKQRAT
jgi:NitT/TauT family transport system ATP-binding protein